ncbi:MAG: MBOAT family protein, partial [Polyangiaceae bacterium]|nr:MBOAT family protein [Polyangiaceae bacterium]
MLFASYTYVVFLIAVVATRWLVPARWVAPILLLASYLFYASAEPSHLLLLVLATAVGFGFGLAIESRPTKRALLGAAVAVPLALLGYFKYADFVVAQWGGLLAALGAPAPTGPNVALPLAISFFTFQIVSYVIDVRRGASAERNPIRFALYLAFFPQLVAG